jgi:16S rRNA (cytosine1402-N4)-methyltransferase
MPGEVFCMSNPLASRHVPVLLREVDRELRLMPGLIVADGTVGAGGHSRMIAERIAPEGKLIGLDRDAMMLSLATKALASAEHVTLKQASYVELPSVLRELGLEGVDRVLLDLGLSSDQLADESRGFSFGANGPLDLRFDTSRGRSAREFLQTTTTDELECVLREYGEEPGSGQIAKFLVNRGATKPIQTASELAEAVAECLGVHRRTTGDKHPATRVFQALRIAVNEELEHVAHGLEKAVFESLKPDGIVVVITFHSLEDRIVKQEFRRADRWESLTPKPVVATHQEQRFNPRSRSAKLRAARKLA